MAAPSAGCLVVDQGDVLLIKIMGGTYGPPGGSVDAGESAQCAAERETYEETGVIAHASELAKRFDNGFHLYWCDRCRAGSAARNKDANLAAGFLQRSTYQNGDGIPAGQIIMTNNYR